MSAERDNLKAVVQGFYDLQKLRISTGNRITASIYAKMGVEPGEKLKDGLTAKQLKLLKQIEEEYKRITDGVVIRRGALREHFTNSEVLISNQSEFALAESYFTLIAMEDSQERHIKRILDTFPIWTEFLLQVKNQDCPPLCVAIDLIVTLYSVRGTWFICILILIIFLHYLFRHDT